MPQVEQALDWFTNRMRFKFVVNDHKPFWRSEDGFTINRAHERMMEEIDELNKAMIDNAFYPNRDHAEAIIHECADVANFALMIADLVHVGHYGDESGTIDGEN